jgi:hypothetical protein
MRTLLKHCRKHRLLLATVLRSKTPTSKHSLSKLEALSTTLAEMNSSLPSKTDMRIRALTKYGSSWTQLQQQQVTLSAFNTAMIVSAVLMALWLVALIIFHENAGKLSKGYSSRVLLFASIITNFGFAIVLFVANPLRWYFIYCL